MVKIATTMTAATTTTTTRRRSTASLNALCVRTLRSARPWFRVLVRFVGVVVVLRHVAVLLTTTSKTTAAPSHAATSAQATRALVEISKKDRWLPLNWNRKRTMTQQQQAAPNKRKATTTSSEDGGGYAYGYFCGATTGASTVTTLPVTRRVLEVLAYVLSSMQSRFTEWVGPQHWDDDDHRCAAASSILLRSATFQWAYRVLVKMLAVVWTVLDLYVAVGIAATVLRFVGTIVAKALGALVRRRPSTMTRVLLRRLRSLPSSSSFMVSELRDVMFRPLFDFVRFHIPTVQQRMDQHAHQMMNETQESVFHKDPHRIITQTLPWEPVPVDELLRQLTAASRYENDKWRNGRVSGTVYTDDSQQQQSKFMSKIYELYAYTNPLHPGCWPSMNHAEAQVIEMCGHLLHAPIQPPDNVVAGCVTSGGTESILLAVRAHLNHYGKRRGISKPNIICGSTAHAALNKAAEMYSIQLIVINCNPFKSGSGGDGDATADESSFALDPDEVRRRINVNTIMIYASAPAYPQGIVDPIVELANVALEYDIGLHVDACLGGFVLAFLDEDDGAHEEQDPAAATTEDVNGQPKSNKLQLNIPIFDFRNAGVTSMSIDTHKYGYATKGTSVVVYKTRELRHAQYFTYPHWSGGMYATPTLAGSRPGALSVCAWAAMRSMGQSGYRQRAVQILQASRRIAKGIVTRIPELQLLTPVDHATVVVSFGSASPDRMNIYRVSDGMTSRGWVLNELQNPPCLHVCVTLTLSTQVDPFLQDLRAAVDEALREGTDGKIKGTAGIYGAVATIPEGPIECVLNAFTDLSLAP